MLPRQCKNSVSNISNSQQQTIMEVCFQSNQEQPAFISLGLQSQNEKE